MVSRTAEQVFIPLTVGGGVRSVEDVDRLLRAGADKVGLNTAAIARPELLTEASQRYGAQCIVLSVDARRVVDGPPTPSGFEVTTHGGRRGTGIDAVEWARRGEELGAGEILLNSMDGDGTRDGYDLEMIRAVRRAVSVPVIASGGAGSLEHFLRPSRRGRTRSWRRRCSTSASSRSARSRRPSARRATPSADPGGNPVFESAVVRRGCRGRSSEERGRAGWRWCRVRSRPPAGKYRHRAGRRR